MGVKKAFPYAMTVQQLQIRNQHDRFSKNLTKQNSGHMIVRKCQLHVFIRNWFVRN